MSKPTESSASLIAAAPELLAECIKAAETFEQWAPAMRALGRDALAMACDIASSSLRAAIRKAEGK